MLKKLCRIGISLTIILNSCVFAVTPALADEATGCAFEIGTNYVSLKVGEKFNPTLKNETEKPVTWKSSEPDVADVDTLGNICAKKEGTAKITAATENDENLKTCDVNVYSDALVLNSGYKRIGIGESFKLKGIIKGETPSVAEITLASNDVLGVVSINGDTVTAEKTGTTVVTAKAGDKSAICAVEVYDPRFYFENNFFEISGTGSDDAGKGLKGEAKLNLKGTLANSGDVKYTCYASQWMKDSKTNADMYTLDKENMTFKAKGGAYGMVEVVALSGEAVATATIMVGGCSYGSVETTYVTGNELLNQGDADSALPVNYGDHYLWKFCYADYASNGQTKYNLMNNYASTGSDNIRLAGSVSGDYWVRGSFKLIAKDSLEFGWNPGRNGNIQTTKDSILVFRAPKSGKMTVAANPAFWNSTTNARESKVKLRAKSVMPFKVKAKGEDIYQYTFENKTDGDTYDTQFVPDFGTKTIDVQKGEEIAFVLIYGTNDTMTSYWNTSGLSSGYGSMFDIKYIDTPEETENKVLDITLVPGEEYILPTDSAAVSLDETVVSAESGKITANEVGFAEAFMLNADGTKTTVNITVKNMKITETPDGKTVVKVGKYAGGHIYAAEYENERLKKVTVSETDEKSAVDITIPSSGAKVFLWDDNMKPICAAE